MSQTEYEVETDGPTVLDWEEFSYLFRNTHRLGEHVSIVGPTGSGKSVAALALCRQISARDGKDGRPARVAILAHKPKDRTVTALGWERIKSADEWPPPYGHEHVVVWPPYGDPSTAARRQRKVFSKVLSKSFSAGDQTICIDEIAYFEEAPPTGLGMKPLIAQWWRTARSMDLTLIAATQRPRDVSRLMWSEPVWLVIFRLDDQEDLKRVAQIGGGGKELIEYVNQLGGHEFVVVHKPRGDVRRIYVSRVR